MAEAIVSAVLEQLTSITSEGIKQEVKLVVGVDKEVKKLRSNLEAIGAVLVDAEERQVKEKTVSLWLDRLKHASYDIEDVLDEWNYAMLKQQIEGAVPKKKIFHQMLIEERRNSVHRTPLMERTQTLLINEDDDSLLQILHPPLNLEKLRLWNYRGNTIFLTG